MVPLVKEKEDAIEFEFKQGLITFENLAFKHLSLDNNGNGSDGDKEQKLLF